MSVSGGTCTACSDASTCDVVSCSANHFELSELCSGVALTRELAEGELSIVSWEQFDLRGGDGAPGVQSVDDGELRERMSGNLCRCGAYPNILGALRSTLAGLSADAVEEESDAGAQEGRDR